jgi:LmbE family N-acetylglucosaminyl deacetylase
MLAATARISGAQAPAEPRALAGPQAFPEPQVPPAARASPTAGYDNDPYEFSAGDSVTQAIRLSRLADGVRFTWPRTGTQWDTALLAVRSWGAEQDPYVEVSVGEFRIQQYLDANAVGARWLNLSGLREQLTGGAEVVIRTHAVTLEADAATLRLFDNHLDLQRRILVVAPHPDDAEIAAFGLYADRQATVVTVTAGNAGDMNYRASVSDPAEHYALKGYLRAVDSVTIPWQGNIPPERTANLGFFDGRLDAMYLAPKQTIPEVYGENTDVAPYRRVNLSKLVSGSARSNTWQHLVEDLVEVLRKVNPGIVVMPDPRLDTHLDHEFASVALVQALEQWQGNPVFLLYTNHTDGNRYPYGPAGTVVSLPPGERHLSEQKIYSHPTAHALQVRQLFALESMHDLRLSPDEQVTCSSATVARRPDYPRIPEVDYFRRAPRANELFYVLDKTGVRAIIQEFLAQYARAQSMPTAQGAGRGVGAALERSPVAARVHADRCPQTLARAVPCE